LRWSHTPQISPFNFWFRSIFSTKSGLRLWCP
jgi:hypothetical protein